MSKIALVGHDYHLKTSSSKWFIDLLSRHGNIEVFWDSTWRGGPPLKEAVLDEFDIIIAWQVEYIAKLVAANNAHKLVFIPMWDAISTASSDWWQDLRGARIISFCWALHTALRGFGRNSFHFQYFPDPSEFEPADYSRGPIGFFWQRRPDIGLNEIEKLSEGFDWVRFYYHIGIDPGSGDVAAPTDDFIRRFNAQVSHFDPDRPFGKEIAANANVFFAPRRLEGIGMAFLEAMARGQCVVAPNFPTMNEYIEDGVTGILYNPDLPKSRGLGNYSDLGRRARGHIEFGYDLWRQDRESRLLDVIFSKDQSAISRIMEEPRHSNPNRTQKRISHPRVTVIVLVSDASALMTKTIESILCQDYSSIGVIIANLSGGAGFDDRLTPQQIAFTQSIMCKDGSVAGALNGSTNVSNGEYIVCLNAGDVFASPTVVSQAMSCARDSVDVIYGHHISIGAGGEEEFRRARLFDYAWEEFCQGEIDRDWFLDLPARSSVFYRRETLVNLGGVDPSFRIFGHEEVLLRLKSRGANLFHCGEVITTLPETPRFAEGPDECLAEWRIVNKCYANADVSDDELVSLFGALAKKKERHSVSAWVKVRARWKRVFGGLERSIRPYLRALKSGIR